MDEPKKIQVRLRRTDGGGVHYDFDCDQSPAPEEWDLVFTATIDMERLRNGENPECHVAELLMEAFCQGASWQRPTLATIRPVYPFRD